MDQVHAFLLRRRDSTPPRSLKLRLNEKKKKIGRVKYSGMSSLSWFLDFTLSDIDCRDKDSSQIVCAGAVLDFQIFQVRILAFRLFQIGRLGGVSDP